jgi:hypothetical protein
MALVLAFGAVIVAALTRLLVPWLTKRLLRIAIERLPETQRERFSEEWASHIDEVRGEIRKAAFALGCIFAGLQMASLLKSREPSRFYRVRADHTQRREENQNEQRTSDVEEPFTQFHFHCPCGQITLSGEKTVTCTGCGVSLGIRRVREHRQRRDSVTYYGIRILPVSQVERHNHAPNAAVPTPIGTIISRLGSRFKAALANRGRVLSVEKQLRHTNTMLNVEAQGVHDIPEEPRARPVINEWARMPLREGVHVKVGPTCLDGKPHPHAGKTGRITRFMEIYSDPHWFGRPAAMIEIDAAVWPRRFIWVSLQCLEVLSEDSHAEDL